MSERSGRVGPFLTWGGGGPAVPQERGREEKRGERTREESCEGEKKVGMAAYFLMMQVC